MKKKFDAVAFMRKRREELSSAYAGLTWQKIEGQLQQALKENPLWRRSSSSPPKKDRTSSSSGSEEI
jgi:hypothetical protein